MKIRYIFKSLLCFFPFFSINRKYNIIFYYPAHFNRSHQGENSYFEPFYELCRKQNISYIVLEEPDFSKKVFRNPNAIPFDSIVIMILILRKLIPLKRFETFQHREWFIAKLLKPIFFRNFTFSNYIVLSNSMLGFFRGLNSDAKLYDYQHGVITSQHRGYIGCDKDVSEHIKLNDANVMVYGKGFENVLKNAVLGQYYDSHIYSIGQSIHGSFEKHYGKKTILFSLQFADPNPVFNQKILDKIVRFFEKYEDFFVSNHISVLLKHHPRFQHDIDPSPLYKFAFTKLYEGNLVEALKESCVHMTFHSTTTFEAAAHGIPTLLMENNLLNPQFFVDDYDYPLGIKNEVQIIETLLSYSESEQRYRDDAKSVYDWQYYFYQPINETLFFDLIKGEM